MIQFLQYNDLSAFVMLKNRIVIELKLKSGAFTSRWPERYVPLPSTKTMAYNLLSGVECGNDRRSRWGV